MCLYKRDVPITVIVIGNLLQSKLLVNYYIYDIAYADHRQYYFETDSSEMNGYWFLWLYLNKTCILEYDFAILFPVLIWNAL